MSWEYSAPVLHSCPCGKGLYKIIHRSDDWGRTDERWEMDCPFCCNSHGLYSFQRNWKGTCIDQYRWVARPLLEHIWTLKRRIADAQATIDDYLKATYSQAWLAHFDGNPKKHIWQQLVSDGRDYPSVATFYSHCRQNGLDNTLLNYLKYGEVPTLKRVLSVTDKNLELKITELDLLKHELEEADAKTWKAADA